MNPERTHKTHVATSSRQTAFNSRENASSLRATLPGLLLAACLMAAFNAHGAGLGPIFPLEGGTRLATRPDGTTVIVYPITLGTFPNTFPYVMVGQIPVNGQPQGPFVPFPTDTANSFSVYEPDVAVNATNGVIVFSDYVSINPGDPDEYQIGYQFVDTNGLPGGPRLVAAGTESWITDFIVPRVSMNRSGQFAMVWFDQDYLPSHYARGRVFNASGQPIGTGNITLNDQPRSDGYFNAYNPAVAIAPNGSSVYVWEDAFRSKGPGYTDYEDIGHDIYARRVDSTGNPIGSQFRVNSTDNCRHSNAEIAMATNGSFVVVWLQSSSDADGVYLQRFDAAGTRIGQEMRVSPFNGIDPQAAMTADGRFVLAWQGQDVDGNGNGIFAQRFLADGSFYGKTLWINEGTTNSPYQPLLGLADDGTFIMKWIEYTNNFASVNNIARWVSWDATNQTQAFGPRVQTMSPAFSMAAPVTNVTITFDRVMNAATFTTTDVQLADPLGRVISISSVKTTNNQTFTLNFAPQQLAGRYHVAVGPSIQDANGTLMDENSNMIKGEAADTFRGQFVLTSSAITAFPVAEGFESASGDFGGWSFAPGPGTISLTTSNAPHGGANQLFFNTQPTDGASQSATLVVDLSGQSGQTNFFLEFWAKYFLPPGGYFGSWKFFVELSGDGQTWHSIFQSGWDLFGGATNIFPFYTEYRIDLDQASLANGVALDGDVYIRFRHLSTESYFANINMVFLDDVRIVAGNPNVPTLAFPARTTNGQFQFQLAGPVGSNYVIQASTDLITWTPIATNLFTATGFFSITDPSATNYSRRFYRAVLVPRIVLARVTDDFNNGNDAGWSLYAPYAAPSVAFPSGGYRLSGGPGVGAAVKYRPDAKAQDFVTSVDIKNWTQVDQAFGIFSRGAFVAELTGFAFYFIPASGGPDQNILGIVRVDSLTTQPIVALKTGVSLDPAKTYRMVFTGIGPSLTGQLFELTGGAPLLLYTLTGSDASYASGGVNGLVIFDRTGGTGSMDVTFDNFNADQL